FVAEKTARTVAAMTTIRIADGAAFSLCHAQRARLRQDRNPTKKSVQSRRISVNGNGTAHPVTRLENLALGSRLPPTRLDRKTCSAARSSLLILRSLAPRYSPDAYFTPSSAQR